ncbi:hypothetical protein [Amycolatopsis sp. cmx-4-54]|uniref:hypothetical protein n=1 Tax=Amycolatopsis sp. cmx-4-54 TaxID=2790936 RepID=UPI003978E1DC
MPNQRERREIDTRRHIGALADEWRKIAGGLPWWRIDETGPEPVVIATDLDQPLATLHGMWAPDMARYLTAMNKQSGVNLAELLWRIGGHGGSEDVTNASVELLRSLGLEPRNDRYRPR